jgi:hypothetical protein
MENERAESASKISVGGAGAAADRGGVAAGQMGNAAGRDVNDNRVQNKFSGDFHITLPAGAMAYMDGKGSRAYRGMGNPALDWDVNPDCIYPVSDLRDMLLKDPVKYEELVKKPRTVNVVGLLYPCALLVSGWWEARREKDEGIAWCNGIQEWLFNGFHSWGPSWDFTWDFEHPENDANKPSFVAQLGDGDEANSIPVIIPSDKVKKLSEKFQERGHEIGVGVSGLAATVTGVLCHRSHCPEAAKLGRVGGILDFCIWLKPGEEKHKISPAKGKPDIYSAYLWKCVAPRDWVKEDKALEMNQVYFVWEHTNLANQDSVKYNLDSLERKEAYIRKFHDNSDLVLLQKSSMLVPGVPKWSKQVFYDFFQQKDADI